MTNVRDLVLAEVAPPGFKGTVKAMKRKHGFSNKKAFALAWWEHNRGDRSHYKADGTKKTNEEQVVEGSRWGRRVKRLTGGDVAAEHQLNIARRTLQMPDAMVGVMGGMNKAKAREIVKAHAASFAKRIRGFQQDEAQLSESGMVGHVNKELLRHAVGRQIFCKHCRGVLDVNDSVLITDPTTGSSAVTHGSHWDQAKAGMLAKMPTLEVLDGRELFGGRKPAAAKAPLTQTRAAGKFARYEDPNQMAMFKKNESINATFAGLVDEALYGYQTYTGGAGREGFKRAYGLARRASSPLDVDYQIGGHSGHRTVSKPVGEPGEAQHPGVAQHHQWLQRAGFRRTGVSILGATYTHPEGKHVIFLNKNGTSRIGSGSPGDTVKIESANPSVLKNRLRMFGYLRGQEKESEHVTRRRFRPGQDDAVLAGPRRGALRRTR